MHGTRKTCCFPLAALDVHPAWLMQILRHSKITVTPEIYAEVPSAATRDALRKLNDFLTCGAPVGPRSLTSAAGDSRWHPLGYSANSGTTGLYSRPVLAGRSALVL